MGDAAARAQAEEAEAEAGRQTTLNQFDEEAAAERRRGRQHFLQGSAQLRAAKDAVVQASAAADGVTA